MRRTQTDLQVIHNCRLAMLGQTWCALDDFQKSSWITLFQQIPPASPQACPTPYLTFVAANVGLYAATGQILRDAPPQPALPQPITRARLQATHDSTSFGLTLSLPDPYHDHLLIYAAPPVPFALDPFARPQIFRLIGALAAPDCCNAPQSPADLSALYQARFRTRGAGSKIAVKLVGVSVSGQRTPEYFVSALVNSDSAITT